MQQLADAFQPDTGRARHGPQGAATPGRVQRAQPHRQTRNADLDLGRRGAGFGRVDHHGDHATDRMGDRQDENNAGVGRSEMTMEQQGPLRTGAWLAQRLNRVQAVRGYSQRAWAKAAGVSQGTLSDILTQTARKGGAPPEASVDMLLRLCTAARVPLPCLLHDNPVMLEIALGLPMDEDTSTMRDALSGFMLLIQQQESKIGQLQESLGASLAKVHDAMQRQNELLAEQTDLIRKHLHVTDHMAGRVHDLAAMQEGLPSDPEPKGNPGPRRAKADILPQLEACLAAEVLPAGGGARRKGGRRGG